MEQPIVIRFHWTAEELLRASGYHFRHSCRPVFRFASFALCFKALFAALGPFSRAFHQVGTHQLDHGLFGAIALDTLVRNGL